MAATAGALGKPPATYAPAPEKWGTDVRSRCAAEDGTGETDVAGGDPSPSAASPPVSPTTAGDDSALEELREKLMVHLREAADRLKLVGVSVPAGKEESPAPALAADARPWNLRARKSVRRPTPPAPARLPAPAERGGKERRRAPERRKETARFSVELSKEEIAEDLYAMTGSLPRRRPRRRPRAVQLQLNKLFPGLWLTEITPESYKV